MDTTVFHKIADEALQSIADKIEGSNDDIEVDYLQGILTIKLPDNKEFVINKHEPTRQIWFSSPFSGAHKFSYKDSNWIGYEGEKILEILGKELNIVF